MNVGWGTDRGILKYTTTTNDDCWSSFVVCRRLSSHVAHSDVAPGFRIREVSGGGRQACSPRFLVVYFRSCSLTVVCEL